MSLVAVQDNEEIVIPSEDWKEIEPLLEEGEKPFVKLTTGQWLNFNFVKRIYNRFDELPAFKGGDPAADWMEKKRRGEIR